MEAGREATYRALNTLIELLPIPDTSRIDHPIIRNGDTITINTPDSGSKKYVVESGGVPDDVIAVLGSGQPYHNLVCRRVVDD